jgi:hypothetical protein
MCRTILTEDDCHTFTNAPCNSPSTTAFVEFRNRTDECDLFNEHALMHFNRFMDLIGNDPSNVGDAEDVMHKINDALEKINNLIGENIDIPGREYDVEQIMVRIYEMRTNLLRCHDQIFEILSNIRTYVPQSRFVNDERIQNARQNAIADAQQRLDRALARFERR